MPEMSGLELVRRLKERGVALPVIVITGHGDVPLAVEAMRAGVVDFIEKPFDDEVLLRCDPRRRWTSRRRGRPSRTPSAGASRQMLATLSPRETRGAARASSPAS